MTNENVNADELISQIIGGMDKVNGEDIKIFDLRNIENSVCSYFIICSANSNTQASAICGAVQRATTHKPWHIEGEENAEWILMDYVDVVVHIFQRKTREFYKIEELWGDAIVTNIEKN